MTIDIIEIDQDFKFLLASVPDTASLLHSFESPVASFDPHTLVLNVARLPGATGTPDEAFEDRTFTKYAERLRAQLEPLTNVHDKLTTAIAETAWLHENQHFQDCLFTPAGAYRFAREGIRINSLCTRLQALSRSGHTYRSPLGDPVATTNEAGTFRAEVLATHSDIADFFIQMALFNGDLATFTLDYDARFETAIGIVVKVPVGSETLRIPYFPQRVLVGGVMRIVAQPIGFRAITEARAVNLANELIAMAAPELLPLVNKSLRFSPAYSVANMLFTKKLKRDVGPAAIDDTEAVTLQMGRWLFHSLNGSEGSIAYPGLGALELACTNIGPDGFVHSEYNEAEKEMNSTVIGYCETILKFLEGTDNYIASVVGYTLRELAIPGLRYFAEEQDGLPRDWPLQNYMMAFDADDRPMKSRFLPEAIAQFHNGSFSTRIDGRPFADANFRIAWFFWIAFRKNVSQAWASPRIQCPLVHGEYATTLDAAKVELHPHCAMGKVDGTCGYLEIGHDSSDHVDCPWRRFMQSIGFTSSSIAVWPESGPTEAY